MRFLIQPIKFGISGGISAVVSISVLASLTELAGVHYLASSITAYLASFFVNFFLQKQWTFRDRTHEGVEIKMGLFLLTSFLNLALNAALMYTLVDIFHLWYILAQVMVLGSLAIMNFTIYRFIIFRPAPVTPATQADEGRINRVTPDE